MNNRSLIVVGTAVGLLASAVAIRELLKSPEIRARLKTTKFPLSLPKK